MTIISNILLSKAESILSICLEDVLLLVKVCSSYIILSIYLLDIKGC
jgi:hypothetical protein